MSEAKPAGKIVHHPDVKAMGGIAMFMDQVTDPKDREAIVAWFKRKYDKPEPTNGEE